MPSFHEIQPHILPVLGQMAVFLVAVGVINSLILRPFSQTHTGREKRVTDTRATAERETALAGEHRSTYEARLAKGREQADAKRQEIRGAAQAHEQKVLGDAMATADEMLTRAREELTTQVSAGRASLAAEARDMAREMATRVLGRAP